MYIIKYFAFKSKKWGKMDTSIETRKKERLTFIDVLRGLAVIWMIETHVVDVVLYKGWKTGFLYHYLNVSNGFVAVTFLFCAGAGFWLAAQKKADDYKHFKPALWSYLKKIGFILAVAYSLHLPVFSFRGALNFTSEQMAYFMQIDVLQTICYSSILALIILMITPKTSWVKYISAALALTFFSLTKTVWYSDPYSYLPGFLGFMVEAPPVSKFPLFPWAGYFFTGIAVTAFFMQAKDKMKLAKIMAISAFILPIIIFILKDGVGVLDQPDWWRISPFHNIYRVSVSIMCFSLFYIFEKKYRGTRIGDHLVVAGQESLFLYVSHLVLVYGSIANNGFRLMGANNFNPVETAITFFAVTAACYSSAWTWHYLKISKPVQSKWLLYSFSALFLIVFLFKQN